MKTYAVLTGDLVQSSRLEAGLLDELIDWLKTLCRDFGELHPDALVGELDVFRGDSWQLCLQEPALALKAAVYMRAGLKAHPSRQNADTRIGLGLGPVDTLQTDRISESGGEAFVLSGAALDSLADEDLRLRLAAVQGMTQADWLDGIVLPLLDLQITSWTHPESVAVYGALRGWTQEETARHALAVKPDGKSPTRQSIADALKRVCWHSHLLPVLERARSFIAPAPPVPA
ncbi:MAG: hypothetical protein E1N59_1630 [Puniceicoccaceae bacterium 5H]|nr:MAG: hypothetical protein E1N59_1630 [Puniceicoccaceae bacterium 5H]